MNKIKDIEEKIQQLLIALKEQSYYDGFEAGKQ